MLNNLKIGCLVAELIFNLLGYLNASKFSEM